MDTVGRMMSSILQQNGYNDKDAHKAVIGAMNGLYDSNIGVCDVDPQVMDPCHRSDVAETGMVKTSQGGMAFNVTEVSILMRLLTIGQSNTLYKTDKEMLDDALTRIVPFLIRNEESGMLGIAICVKADQDNQVYRRNGLMLVLAIIAKLGSSQKVRYSAYGAGNVLIRTLDHMAMFSKLLRTSGTGVDTTRWDNDRHWMGSFFQEIHADLVWFPSTWKIAV